MPRASHVGEQRIERVVVIGELRRIDRRAVVIGAGHLARHLIAQHADMAHDIDAGIDAVARARGEHRRMRPDQQVLAMRFLR